MKPTKITIERALSDMLYICPVPSEQDLRWNIYQKAKKVHEACQSANNKHYPQTIDKKGD